MDAVAQKGKMVAYFGEFYELWLQFLIQSVSDGEPMEFSKDRRDMITSSNRRYDDAS